MSALARRAREGLRRRTSRRTWPRTPGRARAARGREARRLHRGRRAGHRAPPDPQAPADLLVLQRAARRADRGLLDVAGARGEHRRAGGRDRPAGPAVLGPAVVGPAVVGKAAWLTGRVKLALRPPPARPSACSGWWRDVHRRARPGAGPVRPGRRARRERAGPVLDRGDHHGDRHGDQRDVADAHRRAAGRAHAVDAGGSSAAGAVDLHHRPAAGGDHRLDRSRRTARPGPDHDVDAGHHVHPRSVLLITTTTAATSTEPAKSVTTPTPSVTPTTVTVYPTGPACAPRDRGFSPARCKTLPVAWER